MSAKINPLGVDNGGRRHCAHVYRLSFCTLAPKSFHCPPPSLLAAKLAFKRDTADLRLHYHRQISFLPTGGASRSLILHPLPSPLRAISTRLFRFLFQISRSGIGGKEKPFDLFPLNTARRQLDTPPFCYTQLSAHPSGPSVLRARTPPQSDNIFTAREGKEPIA